MRGYFIDIQGTLIDDKDFLPLPGARKFLKYLNKKKIPFILVTNNTKKESKEFMKYLKSIGFEFNENQYIDPLMIIDKKLKNVTLKPYGNEKFVEIINKNFKISSNPEGIILGIKIYSPDEISEIIEYLLKGVKLYGMHKTSLYVKNNKRYPGLGAVLEMLKYATGKDYNVFGKPKIGLNFDKITIISDDLYSDLLPAKKMGMKSVLVLSGKIKNKNELSDYPDEIYKNIGEYLNQLKWRNDGEKT